MCRCAHHETLVQLRDARDLFLFVLFPDDLIGEPDDSGVLDISNRGWASLDTTIIDNFASTLLVLNIAHNEIRELPDALGDLTLMRELIISHNSIGAIPSTISRCQQLRILRADHNKLVTLPSSIQRCKLLELIFVGHNHIETLPRSLGTLGQLQRLVVSHNALKALPYELANCRKLVEVDVAGNDELEMVPPELRHNTDLILWICKQNKAHHDELEELRNATEELEMLAKTYDDQKIEMREAILKLRADNKKLVDEQPVHYSKDQQRAAAVRSPPADTM